MTRLEYLEKVLEWHQWRAVMAASLGDKGATSLKRHLKSCIRATGLIERVKRGAK